MNTRSAKTQAQIEAMKEQTFGVEVEMNGITRKDAARTAAAHFGTGTHRDTHSQNGYATWSAWDAQGREWKFQHDSSIAGPSAERCELVTPVLTYRDMELLQGLVRELRRAGAKSSQSRGCGVHIHVGSDGHTPQTVRNLVNLMASHEDQLTKAIGISAHRQHSYCRLTNESLLDQLNAKRPTTMEGLADVWYGSQDAAWRRNDHYNDSRYHMLNLHSLFTRYHTIEFRCFNFDEPSEDRRGGLHAGQLKAMVQLCLAMSQLAKQSRTISPKKGQRDNERYAFRCWMLRLGLIGDEFKTARAYFMRNFEGNSAWRCAH